MLPQLAPTSKAIVIEIIFEFLIPYQIQYFYTIKDLREAISTLDVGSEAAISEEEIKQGRVGGRLVTKREVERSKKCECR